MDVKVFWSELRDIKALTKAEEQAELMRKAQRALDDVDNLRKGASTDGDER